MTDNLTDSEQEKVLKVSSETSKKFLLLSEPRNWSVSHMLVCVSDPCVFFICALLSKQSVLSAQRVFVMMHMSTYDAKHAFMFCKCGDSNVSNHKFVGSRCHGSCSGSLINIPVIYRSLGRIFGVVLDDTWSQHSSSIPPSFGGISPQRLGAVILVSVQTAEISCAMCCISKEMPALFFIVQNLRQSTAVWVNLKRTRLHWLADQETSCRKVKAFLSFLIQLWPHLFKETYNLL